MVSEPTRQIHLDFHTSELIPGIGSRFSKSQFQKALKIGRVNLINVFAKGHHGWSYYPTEIGNRHPHLEIDLLGSQIEACHEIGVSAPIYYTMGWSANDAETHPEWCVRTASGEIGAINWDFEAGPDDPKPTTGWKHLCPSGEYHEHIMAQTEELCKMYDVDGFWYDIYQAQVPCWCERCRKGMADAGLNASDTGDVEDYRALTIQRHCEDIVPLIHRHHPDASIYFNGLTAIKRPQNLKHRLYRWNTKNDLEDLPTTWGGYDEFPLRAKWFLKEPKPIVAMSGKFHTSWGEFGGFKHPEALRYEAATMIAFGARCNFGDQLHPAGEMDMTTYRNIGHAYEYVEKIESLGIDGVPAATLGFWMGNDLAADEGAARMLFEEQIDFDIIRPGQDLAGFETIVVPSVAGTIEGESARFEKFIAGGGSVLFLGAGQLKADGKTTAIDTGVDYLAPAAFDMDFTVMGPGAPDHIPGTPFLNYSAAIQFRATGGAEILGSVREPYFSRTYGAYCGHMNTPYRLEDAGYPAVVKKGRVISTAHGLDRMYYSEGAKVHRDLFAYLVGLLHKRPLAEAGLPSAGRISLLHFPDDGRYVLHLLYAPPLERGRCLLIEDMPTLREVKIRLRLPVQASGFVQEPEGIELGPQPGNDEAGEYIDLVIPEFNCHTAVRVTY